MNLPTNEQCMGYFEQYVVPRNIRIHCGMVRDVAVFIAQKLQSEGVEINIELVRCMAHLHDLFKMVSLSSLASTKYHDYDHSEEEIAMWKQLRQQYPGMHENQVAYVVFKDDFPELATALRDYMDPTLTDGSFEHLLVHYADWRVFQERIVGLQERLDYLEEAYPESDWQLRCEKVKDKESKIFAPLQFKPENLAELMAHGK